MVEEPDIPLCPTCLAENTSRADFCEKCGMPIGTYTTLDPIKSIYAQGWAYRRAISGRTSALVFFGMVLIFGPAAVVTALSLHAMFRRGAGWGGGDFDVIIGLLLPAAILTLYGAVLYRVTKGYLRTRRDKPGRCAECGYILTGLLEHRCPECGTEFNPEHWDT